MKTALNFPPHTLDAGEQSFVGKIRSHGWLCTSIAEERAKATFSYSTGLWLNHRHPEVIMFGLGREVAHDVFSTLYQVISSGRTLPTSGATDFLFEGMNAYIMPVWRQTYRSYLGWNRWFYDGDDFACSQIIWPDRAGRFPWDAGSDATYRNEQPDLSERRWRNIISA